MKKLTWLKSYKFSLILLLAIGVGSLLGLVLKGKAVILKPLGDLFLNLMLTAVVPLVFFSISSAVAGMKDTQRLGKILGNMLFIFILTGVMASLLMVVLVMHYPLSVDVPMEWQIQKSSPTQILEQAVSALSVPDFLDLLSKKNMLALIIFSLVMGLGTLAAGRRAETFTAFLSAGNEVMIEVIRLIMLYAPIGLGAYFAYLVGVLGPQLLGAYGKVMLLYYPVTVLYFFLGFSLYAFWAGKKQAVQTFWRNIPPAALTALATGSSVATIPANLDAADKIGIPKDISKVVIPIGATIHMDGSCLSAVVKIALLFGIFHVPLQGIGTIAAIVGIALLSGTVMSGIPGGGFLGEMMIVTLYGFPIQALPIISMVGTLVDPPATMVNAIGDNVASMMVARRLGGNKWMSARDVNCS